eukprot:236359-Pleurochrysis_carterae.AAC.2
MFRNVSQCLTRFDLVHASADQIINSGDQIINSAFHICQLMSILNRRACLSKIDRVEHMMGVVISTVGSRYNSPTKTIFARWHQVIRTAHNIVSAIRTALNIVRNRVIY